MTRHLFRIKDLKDEEILELLLQAQNPDILKKLQGKHQEKALGLVFLEPSTRTRVSFERAGQILGMRTVNLNAMESSVTKGETLLDTLENLVRYEFAAFALRLPIGVDIESVRNFKGACLINGGDSVFEHPTQALLDAATLTKKLAAGDPSKLAGKKLLIVGDLAHSRVASSMAELAPRLGIKLSLCSPPVWRSSKWGQNLAWSEDLDSMLADADAVMALRIQKERMTYAEKASEDVFEKQFQLTPARLGREQILLHPGPVNWGAELNTSLQSDPRNMILDQVAMGLRTRAVILDKF